MSLIELYPRSKRSASATTAWVVLSAAAFLLVPLSLSVGTRALLLWAGSLVVIVAWLLVLSRSRTILLDPHGKTIVIRWRNAVLVRREMKLSLDRFSHVVSYHPFREKPTIVVALVERTGDRELVVDSFSPEHGRRGFWRSSTLLEGEAAKQFRARLALETGLPDGGYRGVCAALPPSEKTMLR